ncbi:hypothetical protein BDV18DRAFT_162642 [Aspergillus unguis]
MSSLLRPQFFCTRPNGTLTPLIAVDELPTNISIRSAPRSISPNETQGMTSLGAVSPRGQFYAVDGAAPAASRPSSANGMNNRFRNNDLQSALMKILADENIPANQRFALSNVLQQGLPQNWQASMSNPSATGWLVPNNGGSPGTGNNQQQPHFRNVKKEYCSYWIRHGECDYQQQGCLYKHEMPHDRAMLEKLGLRDIPRWYRDKFNIPSLLPSGHAHPRPQTEANQPWKEDVGFKTIQYPSQLGIAAVGENTELEKTVKQKSPTYLPNQEQQQMTGLPGASQVPFSTTAAFTQGQTPLTSPTQPAHANKKIDLLAFNPEYMSNNNLLYRPSNQSSFEAPGKAQHEEMVRNLHALSLAPAPTNTDFMPGHYDVNVNSNQFKSSRRPRRLYQGNQDVMLDNNQELVHSDPIHAYHNQAGASSSGASPTSKTTGSQLASPVADIVRGSTTSDPPTRGPSPSTLSPGASPGIFRGRGKDKGHRKVLGPIGSKKAPRKQQSVESSEDDMFFRGKK